MYEYSEIDFNATSNVVVVVVVVYFTLSSRLRRCCLDEIRDSGA